MREVTPEAFLKLAEKCEKAAARGGGYPLLEEAQEALEAAALTVRLLTSENESLRKVCENARDVLKSIPARTT